MAHSFEQDWEVADPGALSRVGEDNAENITSIPGAYPLDHLGKIMSNDDSESNPLSNARENLPAARRIEPSTGYATNIIPVQEAEEVH